LSLEPKDYSIHLLGLGGAGCNILEAFLKSDQIFDLVRRSGVKVSCLALDVADHDVYSLQRTYDQLKEKLKAKAIAPDKITLIARSVKFPTPEAMFEFIERYPEFLAREEAKPPKDYKPWLSSVVEIPPLSGGVGRRRSLSKGIYGLNYYYLRLIEGYMESFKEAVSSSTIQPVIFAIFGVGGGSGSGMAVDLLRHLRLKLGSGFPIVGMGILPCSGDDPPAKGASAFATLNELELLLNRNKNVAISSAFGKVYENPLTACLMLPLGPAFGKTGSMVDAKNYIDDAIADLLINSMRFDISDLFNNIGANIDFGDKWVHAATTMSISYPINDHISLVKLRLEKLARLRELLKDKIEAYVGDKISGTGGLDKIIEMGKAQLSDIFKQWQLERGVYDEKEFERSLQEFVYQDKTLEVGYNMQVKGAEEPIRYLLDEIAPPIMAIGMGAPEGTIEHRIKGLAEQIFDTTRNISKNVATYHAFTLSVLEDLESSIAGTMKLTLKQKLLLGDLMSLARVVDGFLIVLKKYVETKALADHLVKELQVGQKTDAREALITAIQNIQNPELVVLFSLVSSFLQQPVVELKSVDSYLSNIRIMKRVLTEQAEKVQVQRDTVEIQIKKIENEKERIETERSGIKVGILGMGKKKWAEDETSKLNHELLMIRTQSEDIDSNVEKIQKKLQEFNILEKKFEINSQYRKALGEVVSLHHEYQDQFSNISRDRGYYDRVADITEDERLKIMQRILGEEEQSLTRENILAEIIDHEHLKEYLIGTMRIMRLPSSLGLTTEFRTDYIWITVTSPRGVWTSDLASELKTTLSGYIDGEASRAITIREVDSKDPWTIRFLVIAGKSRLEDLDVYAEMKDLYDQSSKGDRTLAHSFLLEQGVTPLRDLPDNLSKSSPEEASPEE
tara:strand:+ start:906 stop:3617 length:2712 start_codon:yes stop_codon:yes gene_type:complete